MHHGPAGSLLPSRSGTELVDDPAEARLAWVSKDARLGSAKTGSKTFVDAEDIERRLGPETKLPPGNWAGVIVADGRVFASTFQPAGKVFTSDRPRGAKSEPGKPFRFRLDAEDVVVALDAETGRTLWRTAEPGGWLRGGGKRQGFQVAPAYADGRVFSLGSTGRLFAHDAASGRKLWMADIGPAHAAAARAREEALAAAEDGRFIAPGGPAWHTSLVVAGNVVIAPTFDFAKGAPSDTGLAGFAADSGKKLWEVPSACSRHATPALWHHGARAYLLTATWKGHLRLIDPADGRVLWTLQNLGPMAFTLAPSADHVMVNVAPYPDAKTRRHPGRWGAVRLSMERGEIAWSLPDEPAFRIPTWFDTVARQRALIRDGHVYLSTEGDKEAKAPGCFLVLDEKTGKILARHENSGPEADEVTGYFTFLEDRLLVRVDSAHGASHGGRHPIFLWSAAPGEIRRLGDVRAPSGFDPVDFTTAYEVFMELPVVGGRVFERTVDGEVACYDFRKDPSQGSTREILLENGFIGLPGQAVPVKIQTARDGTVQSIRALPPDSATAGIPYSKDRREATWQVSDGPASLASTSGGGLAGEFPLSFGSYAWPVRIDLEPPAGESKTNGRWTRNVPGLAEVVSTSGALTGPPPAPERRFPTPWLKDQPVTSFGPLPEGALGHVLTLTDAVPFGQKPASLQLLIDSGPGAGITRSVATAFSFNQSWHEVDASGLRIGPDRIEGEIRVILNPDRWVAPAPGGGGIAGRIRINARLVPEGWQGDYQATWGRAEEFSGTIRAD